MLVYGDQPRRERPRDKLAAIETALASGDRTRALIEAGELAQGLADAEFAVLGFDHDTPIQAAAMALCVAVAGGRPGGAAAARVDAFDLPSEVSVKTPEGYAFYGLYPESYDLAARSYAWPSPPFVIGLRSIGTSLAAVVAAATSAAEVVSVRPIGHPFRRELRLSAAVRARLAAHVGPFAVVDEGPGLSGSSFGAAADALESLGVAADRIVFLPGHGGDLGPEASPRHRARWAAATRLVAQAPCPVADWFADLTGPVVDAGDLPGTTWKVRLGDGFVARFAGLGAIGEHKLARARALHAAGFGPEPLALRHGLLLQRWVDGEVRPPSLDRLGRYLAFRREAFPARPGADPAALIEMARVNVAELLGEPAGRETARRLQALPLDLARPRPIHVDGRMHREKWIAGVKLDVLDHSEAHDLVGGQDIAWDVAGAALELGLSPAETAGLARAADADPVMLALFETCYPAFQVGLWTMAGDPARAAPYRDRLAQLMGASGAAEKAAHATQA
ncbi:hypothetical protein [Phenylobacterium sp.]|uniref:hypothetical protein n=1 Tax=Phenylobacterium sp. TaxID=1871053 RepID=UPI002B5719A2|nr:hypothetical protein [Phenylobacterium sp.]HVI30633.1 hypothetical protein [Phenylobacterium sp.]